MTINTAIEEKILSQLNDAFPGKIEHPKDIFPEHEKREQIMDYLFDFHENGWVRFLDLSSNRGKDCSKIKITRLGIEYLNSLK